MTKGGKVDVVWVGREGAFQKKPRFGEGGGPTGGEALARSDGFEFDDGFVLWIPDGDGETGDFIVNAVGEGGELLHKEESVGFVAGEPADGGVHAELGKGGCGEDFEDAIAEADVGVLGAEVHQAALLIHHVMVWKATGLGDGDIDDASAFRKGAAPVAPFDGPVGGDVAEGLSAGEFGTVGGQFKIAHELNAGAVVFDAGEAGGSLTSDLAGPWTGPKFLAFGDDLLGANVEPTGAHHGLLGIRCPFGLCGIEVEGVGAVEGVLEDTATGIGTKDDSGGLVAQDDGVGVVEEVDGLRAW